MILNEEQTMLKDSAREFCANNAPIGQLRKLRDSDNPDAFDRDTWKGMTDLGWAGIPFPEEFGGLAFGYKGLGVVTEETGRTLTASPLFASVWLAGTAINLGGSAAQKNELLPAIASGQLLMAIALEESHRHSAYGIATTAVASNGGWEINGRSEVLLIAPHHFFVHTFGRRHVRCCWSCGRPTTTVSGGQNQDGRTRGIGIVTTRGHGKEGENGEGGNQDFLHTTETMPDCGLVPNPLRKFGN
jgi:hypothetical protein